MAISSRRLLLQPAITPSESAAIPSKSIPTSTNFDVNVAMILAVLLCALICALGLNYLVRCLLHFSARRDPPVPILLAGASARRRAIGKLPVVVFASGLKLGMSGSECAICLAEIGPGERVRVLPTCGHGFHVLCVDRWLVARPTCPTCRQCLFQTIQKSAGCAVLEETGRSGNEPVEPEGAVTGYR
ncbi:RING-H2 finger protein ATL78 [Platanthera guangdongensis]|uniref:RING-H2 finger protein ATL78 n=1 Tax=Platanthera guangdongensis TaxID=2320717 RepID=A0ABR2MRW2_9ASPA